MAHRKTPAQLVAELKMFNHHDSAAKMESLVLQVASLEDALRTASDTANRTTSDLDRAISIACAASNDAERELRKAGLW
jgi:hypothetical protein